MPFVWIQQTPGRAIYINDAELPPCNTCGQRISECRESDCNGKVSEEAS